MFSTDVTKLSSFGVVKKITMVFLSLGKEKTGLQATWNSILKTFL